MPLNVYTSNRMEQLLSVLGDILSVPLKSPYSRECVVLQSKGLQRWISMGLAQRFGIWANCDYPFPNRFAWDTFKAVIPEIPDTSSFDPGILVWRIMGMLPGFLDRPEFAELAGYLGSGNREMKLYQLSCRIADTFDQYTVFRGDLLASWENGGEAHWQAILWRALSGGEGKCHRQTLLTMFLERAAAGGLHAGLLPERVSVFGISYLPRIHMEVLSALAAHIEVNLVVMSPCREYWGDIIPGRAIARLSREVRETAFEGNPLLASLGKLGRDFSNLILDHEGVHGGQRDLYLECVGDTLLHTLQNDILNLRHHEEGESQFSPADGSIQVHSCHSPMREVETLHDAILALLDTDRTLNPRDILVMTPDMETYAPFISAVFDTEADSCRIPFSIADRNLKGGAVTDAFLSILSLAGGRFTAPEVLDILSSPLVHPRFNLSSADLDSARSWVEDTRIRWGMDETDRIERGFPPYREHSWKTGLDRLLLGYAMPDEGSLFKSLLPYDNMEGSDPARLGKFVAFVHKLNSLTHDLARPRNLTGWRNTCRQILDDFLTVGTEQTHELESVIRIIDSIVQHQQLSDFTGDVELQVFRSWLEGRLALEDRGFGFMTGGVTFCAMLPMRSIPFRVICLLGMNDGSFPRQDSNPGFDLMAAEWRAGDRSLRDEDRYLFLEAILSARDRLYISYTGQSSRDNSTIPPSVLVAELLDHLDREYSAGSGELAKGLVTVQRLQPFSSAYFSGGERLFSYSEENRDAAAQRLDQKPEAMNFTHSPLEAPPEEMRDVPLETLLSFFENPVRFLFRTRLRIRLDELSPPLADREPFELDSLEKFMLKREMLDELLAGRPASELLRTARARGILPPALQGEREFDTALLDVENFADNLLKLTGGHGSILPVDINITLGRFTVRGKLTGIWPDRLLRYRCASMTGKDQVKLLIEHLVLNTAGPEGYPRSSSLLTRNSSVSLRPPDDPETALLAILEYYWKGLVMPLKFFPSTSLAYALTHDMGKARKRWDGDDYTRAERTDPYYQACFGMVDPLDEEFADAAVGIFGLFNELKDKNA